VNSSKPRTPSKKAIELDPVKISNFLELALLFRAQGKFSEAENVLRTESENRPADDSRACCNEFVL